MTELVFVYNYNPLNPSTGGGVTYINNLLIRALEYKHHITLLGIGITKKSDLLFHNFTFFSISSSSNWWFFILNLLIKIKYLTIPKSSIIHTHHPLTMLPFIIFYPNIPKVCTFHGIPLDWVKINYPYLYPIVKRFYIKLEEFVIKNVNIVTTAGNYPRLGLINRHPVSILNKIVVIPSGVDLDIFKPLNKTEMKIKHNLNRYNIVLLFAGRLSEQKNLILLLKSFTLLESELSNIALVVVGHGEKEIDIKNFIRANNVKNVFLKGQVSAKEVPELMNCADVFTLTSWYEASPTVVKEALACGIPVVTTDVGDVREIITDSTYGIIVENFDAGTYSNAILRMIKIKQNHEDQVRIKCRNLAEQKFSFDNIFSAFQHIYSMLQYE